MLFFFVVFFLHFEFSRFRLKTKTWHVPCLHNKQFWGLYLADNSRTDHYSNVDINCKVIGWNGKISMTLLREKIVK